MYSTFSSLCCRRCSSLVRACTCWNSGEPSAPQISQTEVTSITSGGKAGRGLEVLGTGFSRDALVTLDGTALEADETYQVLSPERILVLFPAAFPSGDHSLRIANPPGDSSTEVSFSVAGAN